MPKWKPKTPCEKFLTELRRLEAKISAKRAELADLEGMHKQLEMVVSALSEAKTEGERLNSKLPAAIQEQNP